MSPKLRECVDWIQVADDRVQLLAIMNILMNLWVYQMINYQLPKGSASCS